MKRTSTIQQNSGIHFFAQIELNIQATILGIF